MKVSLTNTVNRTITAFWAQMTRTPSMAWHLPRETCVAFSLPCNDCPLHLIMIPMTRMNWKHCQNQTNQKAKPEQCRIRCGLFPQEKGAHKCDHHKLFNASDIVQSSHGPPSSLWTMQSAIALIPKTCPSCPSAGRPSQLHVAPRGLRLKCVKETMFPH